MKLLGAFLKLVRFPNLVYIVLTQVLLQYCIVIPIYAQSGLEASLQGWEFTLLCASTVLIAAAGYIINDYFDINIDIVNKPDKMVVDRIIKRRWAIVWHLLLTTIGIALGFYVAYQIHIIELGFLQIICAALLWFYSTSYKRQAIIGNVVISLLTALSVVVVGFYERQIYERVDALFSFEGRRLIQIIGAYAVFAFLISWVRELVKDMEDLIGDSKDGCKTLPIIWGINKAKQFTQVIVIALLFLLVCISVFAVMKGWYIPSLYILVTVCAPLIFKVYIPLLQATAPAAFHQISTWIKIIMLTGVLSMLFFRWMLA
jgi:4-hydroxybenzoate polyprenyltransferase